MEQWVSDGRDIVRNRGLSLIPAEAEDLGFTIDMSGGLRGLLMKKPATTSLPATITGEDALPKEDGDGVEVAKKKEYPVQYAECEIRYTYTDTEGNIVDVHCEIPMMKNPNPNPEAGGRDAEVVCHEELSKLLSTTTLDVIAGAGQVTQGMDEAILQTARGETTEWWLDPAFAFRENGFRSKLGSILADAPVHLTLTMVDFTNPMSSYERLVKGEEVKNVANGLFKEYMAVAAESGSHDPNLESFKEGLRAYHRGLTMIRKRYSFIPKPNPDPSDPEEPSPEEQLLKDTALRAVLLNNLATMHYTVGNYTLADSFVTRALQVSPKYDKALFRRALLLIHHQHNFQQASLLLNKMLEDGIGDAAVLSGKLLEIKSLKAAYEVKSKNNAKGMFKGVGENSM